jgi:hypothetical protein
VYSKELNPVTELIVKVPLYAGSVHPAIVTLVPGRMLCLSFVSTVAVSPDDVIESSCKFGFRIVPEEI